MSIERINSVQNAIVYFVGDSTEMVLHSTIRTKTAISTYLWLRYPDKYYIFKLSEVKAVASELET